MKRALPTLLSIILFTAALSFAGDCGDANSSGTINALDITYLINFLYKHGPAPNPLQSGDVNGSTTVNALDITYLINFLYKHGPAPNCGMATDIDGNIYQTLKIGNQVWMMENLKVTHYRNGDPIPNVPDSAAWVGLSTGAYCEYDNDANNVTIYGRLYNWYAEDDSRNIAPAGWHLPSDAEWKDLEIYLGMSLFEADAMGWRGTDEGGKLKEADLAHWFHPNTGATNESGFTALPAGFRLYGYYTNLTRSAYFWTSTEYNGNDAWCHYLAYNSSLVGRYELYKTFGFSIRCIKD